MKSISKYVKSEGRLEVLESPYMNFRTTSNKAFDEMFKKFIFLLSTKDADYGMKEEKGATKEELNSIIKVVEDKLNELVSKIEREDEKESFIDNMEKIRICGDFGKLLYDKCNISKIADTIENEDKKNYFNLLSRVNYLLIKGNNILNKDNFNDYDIVITDIAHELEQLESYVKNPEYPIEEIRNLQAKLDTLSKSLREKLNSNSKLNSYDSYTIDTTNEKLKFECEKISGLLLYLDEDSELDNLYTLVYQALECIESEGDFNSFINFMKDMCGAGKLGERLYNNFELDFKNLEYQDVLNLQKITNENISFENEDNKSNQTIKEEIVEQNTNEFSSLDTLDEISRTVAAAVVMCEDEKNLNTVDSLLDLLYESKEKANIMYLKNKSDEAKEYCDLLDELIKNYEEEKLILNNIVTK